MLVENIVGNTSHTDISGRDMDTVEIDWFEVNKKILKKVSSKGRDIGFRLSSETHLHHNDIVYLDDKEAVVINISESDAIVVKPFTMEEMGKVCYEIGNKHVPLFMNGSEIAVPFEEPLMRLLEKKGFKPEKAVVRLTNGLECHHHEH